MHQRCESKGCLWKISDCLNIVVNFFLSLVQYFGFNNSAVTNADFEKFCEALATEPLVEEKPLVEENPSTFSKAYQELKI